LATLALKVTGVAVINQGVHIGVNQGPDLAAAATVTAIGTAKFFVFFVAKRRAAVAAIACGDFYGRFINKFHALILGPARPTPSGSQQQKKARGDGPLGVNAATALAKHHTGVILTM